MTGGGQRFLYETRPDIFPQGYLTQNELRLWDLYLNHIKELTNGN
jgi:hypothetical protein